MHRYDELEKLYYKNKIKKYILLVLTIIFLVIAVYSLSECFTAKPVNKKITQNNVQETNDTSLKNNIGTHKLMLPKNKVKNNKHNKTNNTNKKLIPSLTFTIPQIKETEIKKNKKQNNIGHKQKNKNSEKNKTVKQKPKIIVMPVIREEKINVKDLIKSFNAEPKYDTAIIVSKYFFNKNDFSNAKLWALKANNINPSKYQSWKMFARILLKKNDKIHAREVLKTYLSDYGDNDEIKKLLRSIDE